MKLNWGLENPLYETGIDRGVIFAPEVSGVAWSGLISVDDTTTDVDPTPVYLDGIKQRQKRGPGGQFSAGVKCYSWPEKLNRARYLGFSYRTLVAENHYKIHLVYNAIFKALPPAFASVNQAVEPIQFQFAVTALKNPVSHLIIDSAKTYPWVVSALEDALYGTDESESYFPSLEEVIQIFEDGSIVKVTDHGDGSFTVEGPDEAVYWTDDTEWEVNWPSAIWIDGIEYTISSL